MVKRTEERKTDDRKEVNDQKKEIFKTWEDSYTAISKMWGDSLWVKIYQNNSGKLFQIPGLESNKETFEKLLVNAEESNKIYSPLIGSILKLSAKSAEISRGNANPQAYKEFYTLCLDTYQETYGKLFDLQSENTSKEVFESFVHPDPVSAV